MKIAYFYDETINIKEIMDYYYFRSFLRHCNGIFTQSKYSFNFKKGHKERCKDFVLDWLNYFYLNGIECNYVEKKWSFEFERKGQCQMESKTANMAYSLFSQYKYQTSFIINYDTKLTEFFPSYKFNYSGQSLIISEQFDQPKILRDLWSLDLFTGNFLFTKKWFNWSNKKLEWKQNVKKKEVFRKSLRDFEREILYEDYRIFIPTDEVLPYTLVEILHRYFQGIEELENVLEYPKLTKLVKMILKGQFNTKDHHFFTNKSVYKLDLIMKKCKEFIDEGDSDVISELSALSDDEGTKLICFIDKKNGKVYEINAWEL